MLNLLPAIAMFIGLLLKGVGCEVFANANAYSPMNPHQPPVQGPWFEGWYTRVTDPVKGISFAIIGTSYLLNNELFVPGYPMNGYLVLLFSSDEQLPLQVYHQELSDTVMTVNGKPITLDSPRTSSGIVIGNRFEWLGMNYSRISSTSIDARIPYAADIHLAIGQRISWDVNNPVEGPEGLAALLPLQQHWYVYSLGSKVTYRILFTDGRYLSGSGYAHQEKNWGTQFPKYWVWSQGISANITSQFVLAGGDVGFGSSKSTGWMLGYRSKKHSLSLNPLTKDVRFMSRVDTCSGVFDLLALSPNKAIYVNARTEPATFGKVRTPTSQVLPYAHAMESFSSTVRIEVYRKKHKRAAVRRFNNLEISKSIKPLETVIFKKSAFEYGGSYTVCNEWASGR